MFEAKRILYLYVETPLHAGTGRGLGGIDLPIQRERTTHYPIVQAGGLKGALRAATKGSLGNKHTTIFGPETANADAHAGALSPHDARILLFPVRSLAGVFAWTTSVDALQRFLRAAALAGVAPDWPKLAPVAAGQALVAQGDGAEGVKTDLICGGKVVLEDMAYTPVNDGRVNHIAGWLAKEAMPEDPVYDYWRGQLARKLCILPDDAFQQAVRFSTEVATRVQLDVNSKTVQQGPWAEEYLPVDTLLYAPLLASRARDGSSLSGEDVLRELAQAAPSRLQLGGDETIGRGTVYLRFGQGGAA